LTLPGGDGLRILAEIRKNNRETGVIITTARGQLGDRIAGLDLGADDYLPKPFHLAELAARIRSVWRRHNGNGMPTIKSGLLSLEIGRNEVLAKGVPVSLTRTELSLLQFFISNPGRVITKEALAEHLWGPSADSSDSYDSLYSHIKNLRKKLTEIGCASYLDSVYGMGYKWQPE
jgi:DNA-binding response OmpR family regulator